jgi:hypothetical protein
MVADRQWLLASRCQQHGTYVSPEMIPFLSFD